MVSIPIDSTETSRCCMTKTKKLVLIGLLVTSVIAATVAVCMFMIKETDVDKMGPRELSDHLLKLAKKMGKYKSSKDAWEGLDEAVKIWKEKYSDKIDNQADLEYCTAVQAEAVQKLSAAVSKELDRFINEWKESEESDIEKRSKLQSEFQQFADRYAQLISHDCDVDAQSLFLDTWSLIPWF